MTSHSAALRMLGGLAAVLVLALGLDAAQIAPAGSLAGQWAMDSVTGTTTPDLSGNGNTATLVGGPTAVAGVVGTAMQLNGSSQYLSVANATSLDVASGSFSAAAWIRPATNSSPYRVINKWDGAKGWLMDVNATTGGAASAGFIRAKMNDGTTNIDYSVSGPIVANTWQHIAMTIDRTANQLKLFVNGVQVGTTQSLTALTGSLTTTALVGIGTIPPSGNFFNGQIDEVLLYRRVLTGAELTSLAATPPPAPTALTPTNGVNQVSLAWSPAAGATSYRVLRSSVPGGPPANPYVVIASGIGGTAYTDMTAAYPNTYYYVVQGVIGANPGPNSNEATGVPLPQPVTATPNSGLQTNENGATANFTIQFNQPTPGAGSLVTVSSNNLAEGTVSTTFTGGIVTTTASGFTIQLASGQSPTIPVTITGVDDAAVDGNILFTISVSATNMGVTIPDVSCTNNDNDVPGITIDRISGLTTSEDGGQDSFSVVLNTQPSADVTLTLTSGNPNEGTVSPTTLTFRTTAGGPEGWNYPHVVTLTGVDDAFLDFTYPYTIITAPLTSADPNYDGIDPPDISAENLDNEVIPELPKVWGKGCGLLGLEAVPVLALLRRRRR